MARVRVLLFARLADLAGCREDWLEVPEGERVSDLAERLAERHPRLRGACSNLAFAVNAEYVDATHRLHEGDEVALIPPVSGGSHV